MPRSLQMKGGSHPPSPQRSVQVLGALEDKGVVSVRGVWIAFREGVIHKNRKAEGITGEQSRVQRRIFVGSLSSAQPIENEGAVSVAA